jgi:hypothetical protein
MPLVPTEAVIPVQNGKNFISEFGKAKKYDRNSYQNRCFPYCIIGSKSG